MIKTEALKQFTSDLCSTSNVCWQCLSTTVIQGHEREVGTSSKYQVSENIDLVKSEKGVIVFD